MKWILKKILGSKNDRDVKKMHPMVQKINAFDESLKTLSDEELRNKTNEFRNRIANGESLQDIEYEAFATVKNAARRLCGSTIKVCGQDLNWDMVHFDVQLIGALRSRQLHPIDDVLQFELHLLLSQ